MKKNLFSFPRSKVRMLKGSKGVWLFLIMFWMINTAATAKVNLFRELILLS